MTLELTPLFIGLLTGIVISAGLVNGLAGFGFAVVGTMALATLISPATAVVIMIVPILAANVTLVSELSREQLARCGRQFAPLVVSALLGTILGMVILDLLPEEPVRVGLGLITLGFVATRQQAVALPSVSVPGFGAAGSDTDGRRTRERPVVMVVVGAVSGLLFGATNVGIQLVAYLRSLDMSHSLFVGVVAMVFVGINTIRVGAAGALGLYPTLVVFGLSVAAAIPAVGGVLVGRRVRDRISSRLRRWIVLWLLTIIALRLVLGGLGLW